MGTQKLVHLFMSKNWEQNIFQDSLLYPMWDLIRPCLCDIEDSWLLGKICFASVFYDLMQCFQSRMKKTFSKGGGPWRHNDEAHMYNLNPWAFSSNLWVKDHTSPSFPILDKWEYFPTALIGAYIAFRDGKRANLAWDWINLKPLSLTLTSST